MGERKYLVTSEELSKAIEEAEGIGIPFSQKGAANGVATLDGEKHLSIAQVPPSVVNGSPNIFYVSKTGNDTATGERWGSAFLTIKKAVEALEATAAKTGTIQLGYGTWEEAVKRLTGGNIYGQGGRNLATVIKLPNGTVANVLQDQFWGSPTTIGTGGEIDHLCINGNASGQSFTAPQTLVTASTALSSSPTTLPVVSTTGFAATQSKTLWVGYTLCNYTSVTSEAFEGVTVANGTSFTAGVEMLVNPGAGVGHGIALQSLQAIVGADVYVTNTVGSLEAIQGAGESNENSYEASIESHRGDKAGRWGLEILPHASDGMANTCVRAECALGEIFIGSAEWEWVNMHPVGSDSGPSALQPQLIKICAEKQQFRNLDLDYFPYDGIRIDTVAMGRNIYDLDIEGICQSPCSASAGAGSLVLFYGTPSSVAERLRFRGSFPGRIDRFATPYPTGYLVGVQNLAAPTEGKVQLLSALQISPKSAWGGTLTFTSGDVLSYTGTSSFGNALKAAAESGATTLELYSTAGLSTSGIVTVNSNAPATNETQVKALRVSYTKITGKVLEGVTGVTEALAANTGVAQHFITGVTGGTNASVADDTTYTQTGRTINTISGHAEISVSGARNAAPFSSALMTLRFTGETNQRPNPFLGALTIASGELNGANGQPGGRIAHNLKGTPKYFEATPTADPQQRWWATVDGTNVYINMAEAASTAITFNVVARYTPI